MLAFLVVGFTLTAVGDDLTKPQKLSATIKNIETVTDSVALVTLETSDTKETTYTVDSETKIRVNGKEGTVADLKTGQTVTAEAMGTKLIAIEA